MPTACRLSQTLGHASSFMRHLPQASSAILKAHLPFVALIALSRETLVAAGASSSAHLTKVAAKVGRGCPSFGGQCTVASARTQENVQRLPKRPPLSIETSSFGSSSLRQLRWPVPGAVSRHQSSGSVRALGVLLSSPALVCFAIQTQSKAAAHRAWREVKFEVQHR